MEFSAHTAVAAFGAARTDLGGLGIFIADCGSVRDRSDRQAEESRTLAPENELVGRARMDVFELQPSGRNEADGHCRN
jgi:hypothetical protein